MLADVIDVASSLTFGTAVVLFCVQMKGYGGT